MGRSLKLTSQAVAVGVVALLLALLVWKVLHQDGGGASAAVSQGKRVSAPRFVLPRLDGKGTFDLASTRGKVVVVNFLASWCDPCKREAPGFEAAYRHWHSRGVVFVGVDVNDLASDARSFARRYGLTYPILHDGSGKTLGPYGVPLLPETFFIGRDGKLALHRPPGQLSERALDAGIERALSS